MQIHDFLNNKKLSNLGLLSPLTTYKNSYMGFSKNPLLEIRHLENRHDVIFLLWRSDFDKISQNGIE